MSHSQDSTSGNRTSDVSEKYLTFRLGEESYGIPVLKIREIIRMQKITPVPHMPPHLKGVINLRGKVIPVLDMRTKFGVGSEDIDERTCTVVVQLAARRDADIAYMGLIVDAVEEVLNIATGDIEETPNFGTTLDTRYIKGIAKVKGEVKTLLDIDLVITDDELALSA